MKASYVKLILCLIICLGVNMSTYSQYKLEKIQNLLWLKGVLVDTIVDKNLETNQHNYNPIIDFYKDSIQKKYKNLIEKKSNLFIVYKSNLKSENNLFSIERDLFKIDISNKNFINDKEILLDKGDVSTGIILNYMHNKNSLIGTRKSNLNLNEVFFNDKENNNQLLELIYIPRLINNKEKESIESYLSLKHGISLDENKNYTNSKKDTLWDAKENKSYNKRITGIGRDDFFGLYQKQSKNSTNDGLTIGFNKIEKTNTNNRSEFLDNTFIIWGDNDGKYLLEESSNKNQKRDGTGLEFENIFFKGRSF